MDANEKNFITDDQAHRTAFLEWAKASLEGTIANAFDGMSPEMKSFKRLNATLKQCGPLRLYKYQRYSERNVCDIVAGALHLSRPKDLNDVNEGKPVIDANAIRRGIHGIDSSMTDSGVKLLKQVRDAYGDVRFNDALIADFERIMLDPIMLEHARNEALDALVQDDIIAELAKRNRNVQRCGSLSLTPLSASMWDRYANANRGFTVGYSISDFSIRCSNERGGVSDGEMGAVLAPVFYGDTVPDLSQLASVLFGGGNTGNKCNEAGFLYLIFALCQKAKEWEYEREWRIVTYDLGPEDGLCYAAMKPDSVFLGARMDSDEATRVINTARGIGIEWIYRMEQSTADARYSLCAKKVG